MCSNPSNIVDGNRAICDLKSQAEIAKGISINYVSMVDKGRSLNALKCSCKPNFF